MRQCDMQYHTRRVKRRHAAIVVNYYVQTAIPAYRNDRLDSNDLNDSEVLKISD